MTQESMNIALPDNLKGYVLRQVSDGRYTSASEYVRELIRSDQKRKARKDWNHSFWRGWKVVRPASSPRRTGPNSNAGFGSEISPEAGSDPRPGRQILAARSGRQRP